MSFLSTDSVLPRRWCCYLVSLVLWPEGEKSVGSEGRGDLCIFSSWSSKGGTTLNKEEWAPPQALRIQTSLEFSRSWSVMTPFSLSQILGCHSFPTMALTLAQQSFGISLWGSATLIFQNWAWVSPVSALLLQQISSSICCKGGPLLSHFAEFMINHPEMFTVLL